MAKEPVIGFQKASEEAIKAYEDQMDSIKSIKDTVKTILSSTSIIFALISALQAVRNSEPHNQCLYYSIGFFTLVLFALLIGFSIYVLLPKRLSYPLRKSDWNHYDECFMGKGEIEVYSNLTSAYVESMKSNEPLIRSLVAFTRWVGIFMVTVVVGLILIMVV